MYKYIAAASFLLFVSVTAFAQPVKIGGSFALSGGLAALGQPEANGAILAAEDVNAAGGFNGRPLELILDDNHGDAQAAVTGVVKMLSSDKVEMILTAFTHIAQAVKGTVANSNKVMLYQSTLRAVATENPLFFKDYIDSFQSGHILGESLANAGSKSVALLLEEHEGCYEVIKAAREEMAKKQISIIHEETFTHGNTDFRSALLKIRSAKPQAILACTWRDSSLFMRRLKEAGMISIPVWHYMSQFLPEGDTPEMRALYEENNSVSTWYGFAEGDMPPKVLEFNEKYKARFGVTPRPDAAFFYDDVMCISGQIRKCLSAGALTTGCLRDELASAVCTGLAGNFSFDSQRISSRPSFTVKVKDGKWVRTGV